MYMVVTINELVQYIRDKIQEQKNYAQQAKTKHDESMRQKHMECVDGYESIESMFLMLKDYLDLEENGRLIKLPCKIGTEVYNTTWWDDVQEKVVVKGKTYYRTVHKYKITKSKFSYFEIGEFGKTVFLTKKEAEEKLKELRDGENESSN